MPARDAQETADSPTLDEAKSIAGLEDLDRVDLEEFARIHEKAAEGELNLEHVKLLAKHIPDFVQLQKDTVEGLRDIVQEATESQELALEEVGQSLDGLNETLTMLAESAESDDARIEIAKITRELGEISLKIGKIIREMNEDNNRFYGKVIAVGGGLALAVLVVLTGGKIRLS